MKCPYINPSPVICLSCTMPGCDGGRGKDTAAKQKRHYNRHIVKMQKYHRNYQREHYDTKKNTEKCKKYRLDHLDEKKLYDQARYERKKAERVS